MSKQSQIILTKNIQEWFFGRHSSTFMSGCLEFYELLVQLIVKDQNRVSQSEDKILSGKYHKSRIIPSRRRKGRKILFSDFDFHFQRGLFDKVILWEQEYDFW